jgi:hypothetical protein
METLNCWIGSTKRLVEGGDAGAILKTPAGNPGRQAVSPT